jgi:hypothetical protein
VIFSPENARLVLSGQKTETRRIAKPGEPCRYQEGRTYAVQEGRGKPGIGRIEVLSVRKEELGEIRNDGARREGFRSVDGFFTYWWKLHGKVDLLQDVWVICFRLVEPEKGLKFERIDLKTGEVVEESWV